MPQKSGTLVLVRHGESRLNKLNRFTGLIDVPLSDAGIAEAQTCAQSCAEYSYDVAFTSKLERAHSTLLIILAKQKKVGILHHKNDDRYHNLGHMPAKVQNLFIPIFTSAKLDERYYGRLQGMNKNLAIKKYGKDKVFNWRRGFSHRPPNGESLEDVFKRSIPFFKKEVEPLVKQGKSVLLAGHGNSLRAIIKYLEQIDNDDIPFVNLPHAHPLVYKYKQKQFNRVKGVYHFDRPLR